MGPIAPFLFAAFTALAPLTAGAEAGHRTPATAPQASGPRLPAPGALELSGVRFLQLDPDVVAIARRGEVELRLLALRGSPVAPLELVVSGVQAGLPPVELGRSLATGTEAPAVHLPRTELALWDQVVVGWRRVDLDGTPRGGLLARMASSGPLAPAAGEVALAGGTIHGVEPKAEGYFLTFHCPEQEAAAAGKGTCVVTLGVFSPSNGKLVEQQVKLEPGESLSISSLLVVYATCAGCS